MSSEFYAPLTQISSVCSSGLCSCVFLGVVWVCEGIAECDMIVNLQYCSTQFLKTKVITLGNALLDFLLRAKQKHPDQLCNKVGHIQYIYKHNPLCSYHSGYHWCLYSPHPHTASLSGLSISWASFVLSSWCCYPLGLHHLPLPPFSLLLVDHHDIWVISHHHFIGLTLLVPQDLSSVIPKGCFPLFCQVFWMLRSCSDQVADFLGPALLYTGIWLRLADLQLFHDHHLPAWSRRISSCLGHQQCRLLVFKPTQLWSFLPLFDIMQLQLSSPNNIPLSL